MCKLSVLSLFFTLKLIVWKALTWFIIFIVTPQIRFAIVNFDLIQVIQIDRSKGIDRIETFGTRTCNKPIPNDITRFMNFLWALLLRLTFIGRVLGRWLIFYRTDQKKLDNHMTVESNETNEWLLHFLIRNGRSNLLTIQILDSFVIKNFLHKRTFLDELFHSVFFLLNTRYGLSSSNQFLWISLRRPLLILFFFVFLDNL